MVSPVWSVHAVIWQAGTNWAGPVRIQIYCDPEWEERHKISKEGTDAPVRVGGLIMKNTTIKPSIYYDSGVRHKRKYYSNEPKTLEMIRKTQPVWKQTGNQETDRQSGNIQAIRKQTGNQENGQAIRRQTGNQETDRKSGNRQAIMKQTGNQETDRQSGNRQEIRKRKPSQTPSEKNKLRKPNKKEEKKRKKTENR